MERDDDPRMNMCRLRGLDHALNALAFLDISNLT